MAETPTLFASGNSGQAISTTPTVLSAPAVAGLFSVHFDFSLSAAGDYTLIYLYRTVLSGGALVLEAVLDEINGVQANPVRSYSGIGNDLAATSALSFQIAQTKGTARAYPWKVLAY